MSWALLRRFLDSDVFNKDPSLSIAYLSRYADHVGIHHVLCQKLRSFDYEQIEFFLPQLCHLTISLDNESMALEEFILDLCEESVNAALLTIWLYQSYLHDLATAPQSSPFITCRRIYNKVQHIIFGLGEHSRHERIKDNVLPVSVLASLVLASVAAPFLSRWAGPIAIAQARKPRMGGEGALDTSAQSNGFQKITRSNTTVAPSRGKRSKDQPDAVANTAVNSPNGDPARARARSSSLTRSPFSPPQKKVPSNVRRPVNLEIYTNEDMSSTTSLPLLESRSPRPISRPHTPQSAAFKSHDGNASKRSSFHARPPVRISLTHAQQVHALRQNYFRCETQFLRALEDISQRLIIVPKAARLSALRAELALIAQDLPAEVDIPVICPATLRDGSPSQSRHHRIVRLNPAEATVLNSAEKVPYLLMIEVLREDFSFDPETTANAQLLSRLLTEQATPKRRIFDLTDSSKTLITALKSPEATPDSVFEPISGDLGSSELITETSGQIHHENGTSPSTALSATPALISPRTSGASTSRSSSPGLRRMTLPAHGRSGAPDQPDFGALATHMRTASQMLAQLDSTMSRRPKSEVAAIRAKIIASMQSLEEQSFDTDESKRTTPTFDAIMANVHAASSTSEHEDLNHDITAEPLVVVNSEAGIARMENDQKTGGVQHKGDRDDPSAATFGEAWDVKKERIRKTSPYGWMKNWDVISVIVKTGDDLRQEAFACQLIQACDKIWQDAGVPVWVKRMRILVTGESSGLIETITNGVSLHSLKRSLTLATIAAGTNPRHRIATLRDHFIKAFGPPDSEAYKAAEDAFKRSLAAYSIISYILQLKDRHNGNVLVDNEGHIIHIDFGFMLSNSPGAVAFEAAPFKLTQDYVDVLGGVTSQSFEEYKKLCKQAFQALRRSADNLIDLVSMMGRGSKMPCFTYGVQSATATLRQRFQLQLSADEAEAFVENDLVGKSLGSYYTRLYDTFQYRSQGIY